MTRPHDTTAASHSRSDAALSEGASRDSLPGPSMLVAALALAHVVIWTIVPAVSHRGLPLDVLEGYNVGHQWLIGDVKHPSLPWWLLEASRVLTGSVGWPAYLMSALCIAATYAFIYAIGCRLMDRPRAAAGTLLTSGILYFSWVTPEFNHNVLQMPVWVSLIWCVLVARDRESAIAWTGVGVIGALSLYAKLSSAALLVTAAAFILADRDCRRQIATFGPWLGLAAFLLLVVPLVRWLVQTDFMALEYASARAGSSAGNAGLFLAKQTASGLGTYLLILAAFARPGWRQRLQAPAWPRYPWSPLQIVLFFHFVPLILTVGGAIATGNGLKGAWATSMLSLTGLLFVSLAPTLVDAASLRRVVIGTAIVLVAVPAAYAGSMATWHVLGKWPPRVAWPQAEIAQRFARIWQERTGRPLRIVVGDAWHGGMVAVLGPSHAVLLNEADLALSPSISLSDIERDGALVVYGPGPAYPPLTFRWLTGERVDGHERFTVRQGSREIDLLMWFTIVAPGTRIAPPPPRARPPERQHNFNRKRER